MQNLLNLPTQHNRPPFTCSKCNSEKTHNGIGTGYGTDNEGNKTCYECIGKSELEQMKQAKAGDKFTQYLVHRKESGKWFVTNWPNTMSFEVAPTKGRHNMAGCRYDVWFSVGQNRFHGVTYGDMTQICHITCLK